MLRPSLVSVSSRAGPKEPSAVCSASLMQSFFLWYAFLMQGFCSWSLQDRSVHFPPSPSDYKSLFEEDCACLAARAVLPKESYI